jgi:hypothetical protein
MRMADPPMRRGANTRADGRSPDVSRGKHTRGRPIPRYVAGKTHARMADPPICRGENTRADGRSPDVSRADAPASGRCAGVSRVDAPASGRCAGVSRGRRTCVRAMRRCVAGSTHLRQGDAQVCRGSTHLRQGDAQVCRGVDAPAIRRRREFATVVRIPPGSARARTLLAPHSSPVRTGADSAGRRDASAPSTTPELSLSARRLPRNPPPPSLALRFV